MVHIASAHGPGEGDERLRLPCRLMLVPPGVSVLSSSVDQSAVPRNTPCRVPPLTITITATACPASWGACRAARALTVSCRRRLRGMPRACWGSQLRSGRSQRRSSRSTLQFRRPAHPACRAAAAGSVSEVWPLHRCGTDRAPLRYQVRHCRRRTNPGHPVVRGGRWPR
jgi:hypothetical protein